MTDKYQNARGCPVSDEDVFRALTLPIVKTFTQCSTSARERAIQLVREGRATEFVREYEKRGVER